MITLKNLAQIAAVLEDLGYTGICDRCEAALESDPRQVGRVLGAALLQESRELLARADAQAPRH